VKTPIGPRLRPKTPTNNEPHGVVPAQPVDPTTDFERRLNRAVRVLKPFVATMQSNRTRGTVVALNDRGYLFEKLDPDRVKRVIQHYLLDPDCRSKGPRRFA
jgi:hypothetical protein